VPAPALEGDDPPNAVSLAIVNIMCRHAGFGRCTTFAAPLSEPYFLNVAQLSSEELRLAAYGSILLVTDRFRTRRAVIVYARVLERIEFAVHWQLVFGSLPRQLVHFDARLHEVGFEVVKRLHYRALVSPLLWG
jgi:hypothetical protein